MSEDTMVYAAKRLAVRASEHFDDWWVSHSPRNDNYNAEGTWAEWVELARLILERDERLRAASPPTNESEES